MASRDFEAVTLGQSLPALQMPPATTASLMRWSAATENWHRIHYDAPFATQHDGLPGVVVAGSWKQQILVRLVTEWAGPDGWLASFSCQFRGTNVAGDALRATGQVVGTRRLADLGLAYCDLALGDEGGRVSTTGQAIIALPYREGPPLPDPFPAAPLPPRPSPEDTGA